MTSIIKPTITTLGQNSGDNSLLTGDTSLTCNVTLDEGGSSDKYIKTKKLYPLGGISSHIATAFTLLDEVVDRIDEAREATQNTSIIDSDNAMLHVRAILPELFCCRSIGDGFAAIVNAVYHSIMNHGQDKVFSETQLTVLRIVMKKTSEQPFMQFDDALDLVMDLEDAGFEVEPGHYSIFEEIADE
nr:hypothetical protein [uncultured Desulfobacter sp.]